MYDPNIRVGHVLESEKFFIIMPARSKPQMGEFIPSYQHRFWHLLIFSTDSLWYLYATKAEVFFFSTTHRENWRGLYKNITEHFAALVRHLVTCHKCPVQEINPTHQHSRPNWVCMGFMKKCPRFILSAAGTQRTFHQLPDNSQNTVTAY